MQLDVLKTFCGTCINLLAEEEEEIDLAVGLPISIFDKQKEELKNALQGIELTISVNKEEFKTYKIKSVYVFIQGAGAYYSMIMDLNGEITNYDLANRSCGIIDIGYRTVDYLVMGKGKKGIHVLDDLTGSLEEEGMNYATKEIQQFLLSDSRCGD